MKYKGYIFDFDGVILDTEHFHYKAWEKALAPYNVRFTEDEYEPLKSTGRLHVIQTLMAMRGLTFNEDDAQRIMENKGIYFKEYMQHMNDSFFIPGVLAYIKKQKQQGHKLAVVSSSMEAKVLLNKFLLTQYFDVIIDGNDDYAKKPSPDAYIAALHKLGLEHTEAVIFEDSLVGVRAGTKALVDVIYIGNQDASKALFTIKDFTTLM